MYVLIILGQVGLAVENSLLNGQWISTMTEILSAVMKIPLSNPIMMFPNIPFLQKKDRLKHQIKRQLAEEW